VLFQQILWPGTAVAAGLVAFTVAGPGLGSQWVFGLVDGRRQLVFHAREQPFLPARE